jgi:hypothetical protein
MKISKLLWLGISFIILELLSNFLIGIAQEPISIELVSVNTDGTPQEPTTILPSASISDDGRYVAFISDASNLVDNGNYYDNVTFKVQNAF